MIREIITLSLILRKYDSYFGNEETRSQARIIRHVSYQFGKNISSALGTKNLKIPAYRDLVKVRRYIFNRSQGDLPKKGHSPRCLGNHDQVETVRAVLRVACFRHFDLKRESKSREPRVFGKTRSSK